MSRRLKLELFAALTWVIGIATLVALILLVAYTVWSLAAAVWSR
jgi:hypothetical protein